PRGGRARRRSASLAGLARTIRLAGFVCLASGRIALAKWPPVFGRPMGRRAPGDRSSGGRGGRSEAAPTESSRSEALGAGSCPGRLHGVVSPRAATPLPELRRVAGANVRRDRRLAPSTFRSTVGTAKTTAEAHGSEGLAPPTATAAPGAPGRCMLAERACSDGRPGRSAGDHRGGRSAGPPTGIRSLAVGGDGLGQRWNCPPPTVE